MVSKGKHIQILEAKIETIEANEAQLWERLQHAENLLKHERDRRLMAESAALTAAKMLLAAGICKSTIEACTGIVLD